MLERLSPARRNAVLLLLAVLLVWFCWTIRAVLNPLLLGYLFAFILHPLVERVERRMSRRAAVNLIFCGGFLLLAAITFGVLVQTRALVRDVVEDPEVRHSIQAGVEKLNATLASWFGEEWVPTDLPELWARFQTYLEEHAGDVQTAGRAGLSAAAGALGFVGGVVGRALALVGLFVLVPLYTYYFLFELERIHGFVARYLPARDRGRLVRAGEKIGEVIANFFRGRLTVCLVKGVLLTVGLAIAGVPYAFLFGMASGFLSLIPFFGAFLGFALATLVCFLEHGLWGTLVRTGIVFGLAELIEGYVLIPKILGDSLGLHPIVVLFAILAGAAAMGMFGILVALPLTATLVILAREFLLPTLDRIARGESRAPTGPG
jgi:predicted PurR-regulated permease PerM